MEAEEQARKEAEEKAAAEAAEAKAKADAEEAAHIAAEEAAKSAEVALTRGESSTSDIGPLVLQTLEELHKEQQLVIARLDKQDLVNSSIQNLLTQLLQRMLPPPNPYAPQDFCFVFFKCFGLYGFSSLYLSQIILMKLFFLYLFCFSPLCSFLV